MSEQPLNTATVLQKCGEKQNLMFWFKVILN